MKHTLTFFLISFSFISFSQTTITGGEIWGTLTASDGPYTITDDITVPADSLLIIEPGASLYFGDSIKLIVRGNIKAVGTESSIITFTKTSLDSIWGWGGIIILNNPQSDTNYFKHCFITYTSPWSRLFLWLDPSPVANGLLNSAGIYAESSSPCVITSCSFSKQRIGIESKKTDIMLRNCDFKNTSPFINDPEDYWSQGANISEANIVVENCLFENSVFGLTVGDVKNEDVYNVINCNFEDIEGRSLQFFGKGNISKCNFLRSGYWGMRLFSFEGIIDNCSFDSSYGISKKGKNISISGTIGSVIQNCLFKNTEVTGSGGGSFDIYAENGDLPIVDNCTFDNALGIYAEGNGLSMIVNSTVKNSTFGFNLDGKFKVVNSLFVNNRVSKIDGTKPFLNYSSPGISLRTATIDVYNCIFWDNYDYYEVNRNIQFYDNGTVNLYNCVLKGGKSSITKYEDSSFVFTGIYQDCTSDYPGFADTANGDYRPYQDCSQTPFGLNKGYALPIKSRHRVLGGRSITYDDILGQLTDGDGHTRVWSDTVDIGPYELPLNKIVESYEHPKSLALCENASGVLNSSARGIEVSAMWQRSTDGSVFTDLGIATDDYLLDGVQEGDSGLWYRLLWQNQCGDSLYSNPAMLSVYLPTEVSLGEDFRLSIDSSTQLSPGQGFTKYDWNNGSTAPIINVHGESLGIGEHTFSVEVVNQYGCASRDSIIITVAIINGVRRNNSDRELTAYPNPAADVLYLKDLAQGEVTIHTMNGIQVLSTQVQADAVDVSSLPSGMYLIHVMHNGKVYRTRFVKE